MSEEKKRMKWSDIERIHKAFQELTEALSVAQPYGVTFPAIELVQKAREEASGALLFADFEEGEGNQFLSKEALDKMKREYLEKRLKNHHEYCNFCPNAWHCGVGNGGVGLGFEGLFQKQICDDTCRAVMERLGLSNTLMDIALIKIELEKLQNKGDGKNDGKTTP